MPEEEKKEKPEEETPQEPNKKKTKIEEAKEIAERIEEGNKKKEELLDREEKIMAERELAGTGGGHVETEKKELTATEYKDAVEKGEIGRE